MTEHDLHRLFPDRPVPRNGQVAQEAQLGWRLLLRSRPSRRFDLHVEDLDAIDSTPVLDIKPWFAEFGPRSDPQQPAWTAAMLNDYFAPAADNGQP